MFWFIVHSFFYFDVSFYTYHVVFSAEVVILPCPSLFRQFHVVFSAEVVILPRPSLFHHLNCPALSTYNLLGNSVSKEIPPIKISQSVLLVGGKKSRTYM